MPADRIILEGMQFYSYHGGSPEERSMGQPFEVDLEAELDLRRRRQVGQPGGHGELYSPVPGSQGGYGG